ncbi:MAG: DUF1501 domain-containing protein, partial [Planctomycetaceae bacterium]|nr:DUF1501 domain-containing protein [Planctomycetaceae bacterium]
MPTHRRRFLQSLSAGLMGTSLADVLAMEASSPALPKGAAKAKQVLVVYEEGGISQMDTWDPKPEAPLDHRTPYAPIATRVPGTR